MACERYLNALNDLVDGTLGPLRRAELELHLEGCDDCRALLADLREIARASAALPRLEPPAPAWTQIADRLYQEGRVTTGPAVSSRRRNMTMLALAAALVLAVGASLFVLGRPGGQPAAPPAQQAAADPAAAGNAAGDDPVQSVATELALTERHFQNVIERATTGDSAVNPQTAAVLRKNLIVVNEAINESRKALEADPESARARDSLYEVLRQKIQFLQDTIALMNEMRQGDAAGAAEIVEGGKS